MKRRVKKEIEEIIHYMLCLESNKKEDAKLVNSYSEIKCFFYTIEGGNNLDKTLKFKIEVNGDKLRLIERSYFFDEITNAKKKLYDEKSRKFSEEIESLVDCVINKK